MTEYRIEKDSMGEMKVPSWAWYGAQTQRAVENFPISGKPLPVSFLQALIQIKQAAARVNQSLNLLDESVAKAIDLACQDLLENKEFRHFPVDVYQTGSGTSSNMNANEVIAYRANQIAKDKNWDISVHPNDHVNFGQSSNDVIPTAIRIASCCSVSSELLPALKILEDALNSKGHEYADVVKTGRTHLMDAMPVTFQQVFGGHARQVELGRERCLGTLHRLAELPQGGTAVGTGINTHQNFADLFAKEISTITGQSFHRSQNHFEGQSSVDAPVELSGQLKTLSCSLMKIANDFRWMNSGPNGGLGEVQLAALQPGSSIMPGKVNPVAEEALAMCCAQVMGNDVAITIAGQSGNFELNVMLPLVALNLVESLSLLSNSVKNFAQRSVQKVVINRENVAKALERNPILVTALNPIIGYEKGAEIAKKAYKENRALLDVAKELTDLSETELKAALDPIKMTRGGFTE